MCLCGHVAVIALDTAAVCFEGTEWVVCATVRVCVCVCVVCVHVCVVTIVHMWQYLCVGTAASQ